MPIIKSAKKRVRTASKAAVRNSKTKRSLKGALKAFAKAVTGGKATEAHSKAQSELDKAAKKASFTKTRSLAKRSNWPRPPRAPLALASR